jgi:outer membrane protein OmpA-like peptidoglycan-associated protein
MWQRGSSLAGIVLVFVLAVGSGIGHALQSRELRGRNAPLRSPDQQLGEGHRESLRGSARTLDAPRQRLEGRLTRLRARIDSNVDELEERVDRFVFGRGLLPSHGRKQLRDLVEQVGSRVVLSIRVAGHTDSIGKRRDNRKLSRRRARAACDFLRRRLEVREPSCTLDPRGEDDPRFDNMLPGRVDNPRGRARNRRAEAVLTVIGPD